MQTNIKALQEMFLKDDTKTIKKNKFDEDSEMVL
jgi:hypothetical protein